MITIRHLRSVLREYHVVVHFSLGLGVGILLPTLLVVVARANPDALHFTTAPRHTQVAEIRSGHELYMTNCASCHGARGQGQPNWGSSLADSRFVRQMDDAGMVRFLKRGRLPNDPQSVMKRTMPPRGGNPNLTERDLQTLTEYMRAMATAGGRNLD